MNDKNEILRSIYFDAVATIRHYDSQRASFTQLILSALTVLVGFSIVSAKPDDAATLVRALAGVGVALSVIGLLVSGKLNDLILRQRLRARLALEALEAEADDTVLSDIDRALDIRSAKSGWGHVSLRTIWSLVFVVYLAANLFLILRPDFVA